MKNFNFVFAAYTIIWGILGLYLGSLTMKFRRLKREYFHLEHHYHDG